MKRPATVSRSLGRVVAFKATVRVLLSMLVLGLLVAACRIPSMPTSQPAASEASDAAVAQEPATDAETDGVVASDEPDLTLRPGMQIGLVSTTLAGLLRTRSRVNPDEPGGGTLLTIESVTPEESVIISWRRTRTESPDPDEAEEQPVTGIGTPAPGSDADPIVLHEEGSITATGLGGARDLVLPIYWRPGPMETDTSLIWLSAEALTELKATRTTRWTPDVLTRISQFPRVALEALAAEAEGREFALHAEGEFMDYSLRVDGRPVTIQAIRAHDDFGNEYVILADEANPLVVSFRLNVITTGVMGIDAGVWLLIKAVFSGYEVLEINTP